MKISVGRVNKANINSNDENDNSIISKESKMDEKNVVDGKEEIKISKRQIRREEQKIRTAWSKKDGNKFVYKEVIRHEQGEVSKSCFYNWVMGIHQLMPKQGLGSIAHVGIPVITVVLRLEWMDDKVYRVVGRGISIKTPEDKMDKEGRRRGINKAIGRIDAAYEGCESFYQPDVKTEGDEWKNDVWEFIADEIMYDEDSDSPCMGIYDVDGIDLTDNEMEMLDKLYKNSKRM